MCINKLNEEGSNKIDFQKQPRWKEDPPKRLDAKTIRAFIF